MFILYRSTPAIDPKATAGAPLSLGPPFTQKIPTANAAKHPQQTSHASKQLSYRRRPRIPSYSNNVNQQTRVRIP